MPRPKRSKVASSALPRAKPPVIENDPIEDFSDRDEPPSTKRAKTATLHIVGSSQGPATAEKRVDHALQELIANRDAAMNRLAAEDEPAEETILATTEALSEEDDPASQPIISRTTRTRGRPATNSENSILAISQKRTRQPSILGARGRRGRSRSSSIDSELAESVGMVNRPLRDNSIGPLGGPVRRRQRQPSILGRGVARARSSSVELDMVTPARTNASVLGGRRRERQRSILGTARKPVAQQVDYDESLDLEELGDFEPEDESTPVNIPKSQVTVDIVTDSQPISSATRKRKAQVLDDLLSSPAKSRTDAISDIYSASPAPGLDDLSPPEAEDSTLEPEEVELPQLESREVQDDSSSSLESLSSPPPEPQLSSNIHQDEPSSSIMAPPRSSSSPETTPRGRSTEYNSSRREPAHRATTPQYQSDSSLPSSPPSLTHSPNRVSRTNQKSKPMRASKPVPDPAQFSTAQLQELLPRRRPRARHDTLYSDEDIDVTGLRSDEDEITHLNVRASRRTATQPKKVTKLKSKAAGAKGARTYGSQKQQRAESEVEENEEDEGEDTLPARHAAPSSTEDSQELEMRLGKELKRAKRKFENVDKWELEFEEVTASSSMGDFR